MLNNKLITLFLLILSSAAMAQPEIINKMIKDLKEKNKGQVQLSYTNTFSEAVPDSAQAVLNEVVMEYMSPNTPQQKELCKAFEDGYMIQNTTGVSDSIAKQIDKNCGYRKSNICNAYGCFFNAWGKVFIFAFADVGLGYSSFTEAEYTLIIITPETTADDIKKSIIHELAISMDFKTDQQFDMNLYLDSRFGYPNYRKAFWYHEKQYTDLNDDKLYELFIAFKTHHDSLTQVIFAIIRANLMEEIVTTKRKIIELPTHDQCVEIAKDILENQLIPKENTFYVSGEFSARFKNKTQLESDFKQITRSDILMPFKFNDKNITFCQYLMIPEYSRLGIGVFNGGPRPVIRPGGWIDASLTNSANIQNTGLKNGGMSINVSNNSGKAGKNQSSMTTPSSTTIQTFLQNKGQLKPATGGIGLPASSTGVND
jgi:hypothetical protein